MKLYLSSMPTPNKDVLLRLLGGQNNPAVAVIPNAWDTYPAERKTAEVEKLLTTLRGFGFTPSLLDLTVSNQSSIKRALDSKELVWVMGGNTFYLNFYIHQSGFSDIIPGLLEKGLVYAGESAGAVVAGTTLHGIEHLDDPNDAPATIWEGLSLLDKGIVPHWGWERYGAMLTAAKKDMSKFSNVITINNDQILIIDNDQETFVQNSLEQA